jgi:hypothetical protein
MDRQIICGKSGRLTAMKLFERGRIMTRRV